MRKFSGILFGFFAAALIMAAVFCFGAVEAKALDHSHCICGGTGTCAVNKGEHTSYTEQTWLPIGSEAELRTAATAEYSTVTNTYYYLTDSFEVTGDIMRISNNHYMHLCLNGQTLTRKQFTNANSKTVTGLFLTNANNNKSWEQGLVITDCHEGENAGTIQNDSTGTNYLNGGTLTLLAGTTFELYNGTIDGAKAENGGTIEAQALKDSGKASTVRIYGGTVTGGTATKSGGNIRCWGAALYIYGGTISYGQATAQGGNINLTWQSGWSDVCSLYGGTVTHGTSSYFGGNLGCTNGGIFNIYDGATVEYGTVDVGTTSTGTMKYVENKDSSGKVTSYSYKNDMYGIGGNIGLQGNSALNMYGGLVQNGTVISGGTRRALGGNIGALSYRNGEGNNIAKEKLGSQLNPAIKISGGTVKNGKIVYTSDIESDAALIGGANISIGGNIHKNLDRMGTLTITGGTFTHDVTVDGEGNVSSEYGVIYNGSTTKHYSRGGNIRVFLDGGSISITGTDASPVVISNGAIKSGVATWAPGGNIYFYNVVAATIGGNVTIKDALEDPDSHLAGGNLYKSGSGELKINSGVKFLNGAAQNGGNIEIEGAGKITMTGVTLENGSAYSTAGTGGGGNLVLQGTGAATLTNCTFKNGKATEGCGGNLMINRNSTVTVDNCTFEKGTAAQYGGNIAAANSTYTAVITIKNSTITEGRVTPTKDGTAFGGGNVYMAHVSTAGMTIENCTITDGWSRNKGGNILVGSQALVTVKNSNILRGTANLNEGGNIALYGRLVLGLDANDTSVVAYGSSPVGGNVWANIGRAADVAAATAVAYADRRQATFIMNGGTVKNGITPSGLGRNIRTNGNSNGSYVNSTVIINGGNILLFKENDVDYTTTTSSGANVYLHSYFELNGGTISGGKSASDTGGVFALGSSTSTDLLRAPHFVMNGGTITNGEAKNGGLLAVSSGATVEIKGGTLSNGTASGMGGAIYTESNKLTITGGTFQNNTAATGGTLAIETNKTVTLGSGVTISGGTASDKGGNIHVKGTLILNNGATVSGGSAVKGGGNIYNEGTLTMNGGTVTGGNSEESGYGGNIYNASGATFTLNDGTISDGRASYAGNIVNKGTMKVYGGMVTGGNAKNAGGNFEQDDDNASFTMSAGSFLAGSSQQKNERDNVQNAFFYKGSAEITGGIFGGNDNALNAFFRRTANGKSGMTSVTVSGGYFAGLLVGEKADSTFLNYITDAVFTVDSTGDEALVHAGGKLRRLLPAGNVETISGMTFEYGLKNPVTVMTSSRMDKNAAATGVATLSGAGTFAEGDVVRLTAQGINNNNNAYFLGWFKGEYQLGDTALQNGATTLTLVAGEDFTDQTTYYAVYYELNTATYTLTIHASGPVTLFVAGAEKAYTAGMQIESGKEVSISYGENENYDFFGWENENGRTLTSGSEYVFTIRKNMVVNAAEVAKAAATKLYVLMNDNGQVLQAPTAWVAETSTLTDTPVPVRIGYTGKWFVNEQEATDKIINESTSNYIIVKAVYTADETFAANNQYTITVKQIVLTKPWTVDGAADFTDNEFTEAKGTRVVIGAPETYEGSEFAYYALSDGKVLSYKIQVATMFGEDTIVYAVYVPAAEEITKLPTMSLSATTIAVDGGLSTKFTATRDIPDGYALIEHGILYVAGKVGTNAIPTAEEMEYGKTKCAVSNATGLLGTVSLNIGKVPNGYFITARGYAIVQKGNTVEIVYSDILTIQP